ncbi:Acyl-CoA-binding domain-containing protein 2 [Polyplax serrata]|uniref:Acyl-CoA-binding domain-containing protein 2 n=1 Tax=Polyplax serrata TaxID=468196 RepID=A0ABR1AIY7_POLSC
MLKFFFALQRFDAAAEKVRTLTKKPTDEELLSLYGLFKQGSVGDNETSKPGFLDMKGKYKWEAWMKLKGKSQDEAKEEYIKLVESLLEKYS